MAFDLFRKTPVHTAIVVDEFGALQGLVIRTDLLETVAGDLPKIDAPARPKIAQREDGSCLIDASVPFPDAMRLAGISEAPFGDYVTLAGFILSQLHELPKPGDNVMWARWRFEVVDMEPTHQRDSGAEPALTKPLPPRSSPWRTTAADEQAVLPMPAAPPAPGDVESGNRPA